MSKNGRRKIKFRAKEWEGDNWVIGGGVEYFGEHAAMIAKGGNGNLIVYKVESKTVGEFTGLKDKNGKEICEGDIVQWDNELYKVIYDQAMAQFNHRAIDPDGHDDYFELENNERQKVIGNIHENPELMEVKMSKMTAQEIAHRVDQYFEADDEELVENLAKEIRMYHAQKMQELEEFIKSRTLEAEEMANDHSPNDFYESEYNAGKAQLGFEILEFIIYKDIVSIIMEKRLEL